MTAQWCHRMDGKISHAQIKTSDFSSTILLEGEENGIDGVSRSNSASKTDIFECIYWPLAISGQDRVGGVGR